MWNSGFESYGSCTFRGAGGYTQPPGGFGLPAPSQAEKKSRAGAQHVVPCTVTQLLSAAPVDEVLRIGGIQISQVTLVGTIRPAEKALTSRVSKIEDTTAAPVDVHQWVDREGASGENNVVPPETYVKVTGHLGSFQNQKYLVAFTILPLEDTNEFTARILGAVNTRMILSKASSQPSAGRAPISSPGMGAAGDFGGTCKWPRCGQNQVLNLIRACP